MGGKTKTPAAPDYTALANQQAQLSAQAAEQQAALNRVGQVTPFADTSWARDPISGQWFQSTYFAPEQQAQYDQLNALTQQALNTYNPSQMQAANLGQAPGMPTAVDYSKLGAMPQAVDYTARLGTMPQVGGYNQQVIDTINKLQAPDLQRQREAEQARMAAMGVGAGTGMAYQQGQQALLDAENKASLNAIMQGIQQGNTEYNQALAGRQLGGTELANQFAQAMQARQQGAGELERGFTQQMGLHTQGIQDLVNQQQLDLSAKQANLAQLSGLYGLGNQQMARLNMPGIQAAGQNISGANLLGAANAQYQAQLDAANAANADAANSTRGWTTGIGALGGGILGFMGGGPAGALAGAQAGASLGGGIGGTATGGGWQPLVSGMLGAGGNSLLGYGAQALGNSGLYSLGSGYAGNIYAGTQGYSPLDYSTYNSGYYDT
jgi:hypothetical protein